MGAISLPNLGVLVFDQDGVAEHRIEVDGAVVELDVWSLPPLDRDSLQRLDTLLGRARLLVARARRAIAEDLDSSDESSAAGLYRAHHGAELDCATLELLWGTSDLAQVDDEVFLSSMRLDRVGIYPGDANAPLLLDFTLGHIETDYVLSVTFDAAGRPKGVNLES